MIVHNIGDRHNDIGNAVRVTVAVHAFGQTDKANVEPNKQVFYQISRIGIVAGEPGKVFHNDTVDFPAIHIGQQSLKILTVSIRPGFAVVNIYIAFVPLIELVHVGLVILLQQKPLIDYAVAFVTATEQVLLGKSDIFPQPPAHHFIRSRGTGEIHSPVFRPCHLSSFPITLHLYYTSVPVGQQGCL